uniref:Uncharacterized protein n=1 Tax=Oryza officinalis TaxID=4535 RepID=A0A1V1H0Y8_9ORYZ|nr:hypothetical protein [Oryza officinalis]
MLDPDGPELKDKTPEKKEAYIKTLHKQKRVEVATYLVKAMLSHQDKNVLMVPYALTLYYARITTTRLARTCTIRKLNDQ